MHILHLPSNPAGQMSSQVQALNDAGMKASFCSYIETVFRYPSDIPSPIANIPADQRQKALLRFARESIPKYDLFHFQAGLSFTLYDYLDLPMLKDKKKVMNFWGSEVRRTSIAKAKNPYARIKHSGESAIMERLIKLSKHFDHVIVPDYEIWQYVGDYFENVHLVPYVVDGRRLTPAYPDREKKKPLIIHAPSDPYLKGTEFVQRAVNRLQGKVDFDLKLIENMPHDDAMKWYAQADIIVDQLCIGVYSILSIESMLLGKPVITYIRPDLQQHYPPDLPIVSANPDTIEETLRDLLSNPAKRRDLGLKGREYAMKYHAPEAIAKQLIDIYGKL